MDEPMQKSQQANSPVSGQGLNPISGRERKEDLVEEISEKFMNPEKIPHPEIREIKEKDLFEKEHFREKQEQVEGTITTRQPPASQATTESTNTDLNNPQAKNLEQQIQLFVRTALGGNEEKAVADAKKTFSDNNYALDRFHDLLLEARNKKI